MSFWIVCDWCGKRLNAKENNYAILTVEISHPGAIFKEVDTSRHLCANRSHRDLADRMGLPIGSLEGDPTCYERAVAAIEGTPTDRPDMGMEWRLVPIHPDRPDHRRALPDDTDSRLAVLEKARQEANQDDGIGTLSLHHATYIALVRNGITKIAQVEAMTDDELLVIPRIGPGRLSELRAAVAKRQAPH